jgi:phage FluMu gp28-like protein
MSEETQPLPTADQAPPRSPVDELVPGALPPPDLDPLGDGILMAHQKAWVEDQSPFKAAEKGRRTGITFAEALDSTIWAAATRAGGGDNTWYIGDTKEKGLEFVGVCAAFARHVAKELLTINEFVFEDAQEDGTTRAIAAYRARFASGFQIAALSSRPAAIRGLQGRVVIDEAAFHQNVAKVIDACNALLIWGGVIRVISTHNGALNPFAELISEIRAGKRAGTVHRITFDDAVKNGLYERVRYLRGKTASAADKKTWYETIRRSFGSRVEAMREELDVIPREGEGVLLPLAWIESCATADYAVKRWAPPAEDFVDWPEAQRRAEMLAWLEREVAPLLARFAHIRGPWALGEDFAMRQDRTCIALGYTALDLRRHVPLLLELARCPYDQQKQALFWLGEWLRARFFQQAILDANGNGMVLAQEARQRFGVERVLELVANDAWHREQTPKFRAAFEDKTIRIPADIDVRDDLRLIQVIGGVGKIPSDVRNVGVDGGRRHADAAVALMNFYAASCAPASPIEFQSTGQKRVGFGAFGEGRRAGPLFDEQSGFGRARGGTDLRGF